MKAARIAVCWAIASFKAWISLVELLVKDGLATGRVSLNSENGASVLAETQAPPPPPVFPAPRFFSKPMYLS